MFRLSFLSCHIFQQQPKREGATQCKFIPFDISLFFFLFTRLLLFKRYNAIARTQLTRTQQHTHIYTQPMPSHGSRSSQSTRQSSEQSDLKKLKSKYASQLSTLRELFADWSDEDLLFALQEVDGDLDLAIDRISEGKYRYCYCYQED